jgi:putative ATP-dependent endonuclease of the OLD family
MEILALDLINFRCYKNLENITFQNLTVFIGANDVGKTALARALELLLTMQKPKNEDFYKSEEGELTEKIVISGTFSVSEKDRLPKEFLTESGNQFKIKKEIESSKISTPSCFIYGRMFTESRFISFEKQSAEVQKELLKNLSLVPGSNSAERIRQFLEIKGNLPYTYDWIPINWVDIEKFLPIFDRVSSYEYENPEAFIQNILREHIKEAIFIPDETGSRTPIPEILVLQEKIKVKLNEEIAKMEEILRTKEPRLKEVKVEPSFDFSKGVIANQFMIKIGEQLRHISVQGEGVRKKIWMGLLEWQIGTQNHEENRKIIRVYDEPDVNLDYYAERKLIQTLVDIVEQERSSLQVIVLTHSIALIDSLPINSIRLIKEQNNERQIDYFFDDDEDEDYTKFIKNINSSLGIKNSEIFFERGFIVVEGETEQNALPILYKKIYKRPMQLDGIIVINLSTCGAWESVLRLVLKGRHHRTVMLLDSDCKAENSSAKVTLERIGRLGLNQEWIDSNVSYVGEKEFEDAFSSDHIVHVLNEKYGKEDGTLWQREEIDAMKRDSEKFSEDLMRKLRSVALKKNRAAAMKPQFGENIALLLEENSNLPEGIQRIFDRVRELSGIG